MSVTLNTPFSGGLCDPVPPQYEGMSIEQLQSMRLMYQQAYARLSMGEKETTVTYASGEGNRSVTFQRADANRITAELQLLSRLLNPGSRPHRHANPVFW